jgi:TRAP-type C4-dicarboxylate transport system permease small subunit
MLSETDLTFWDQFWIVVALMVTATLAMLAGVQIERAEQEKRARAREMEDAAMRQATVRGVRDIVI